MYRVTAKAKKHRERMAAMGRKSQAVQAQSRMENAEPYTEIDHGMRITIERFGTGETAVFECSKGNRIDNYRVVCNGVDQGVQSISTLTANIRKALPAYRRGSC